MEVSGRLSMPRSSMELLSGVERLLFKQFSSIFGSQSLRPSRNAWKNHRKCQSASNLRHILDFDRGHHRNPFGRRGDRKGAFRFAILSDLRSCSRGLAQSRPVPISFNAGSHTHCGFGHKLKLAYHWNQELTQTIRSLNEILVGHNVRISTDFGHNLKFSSLPLHSGQNFRSEDSTYCLTQKSTRNEW